MYSTIKIWILIVISCFLTRNADGQCGVVVDAGPDIFTCFNGGDFQMNGSITGTNVVGYQWTPATGLSDPTILNPTTNVTTTTTYTLTAQVFDPTNNIIVNGDFDMGDTGFTSDYIYGTGGAFGVLSNEGQYAITTNSSLVHNNFANCNDHTGGGSMMVVNGATTIDENIWCQQVPVMANTNYTFSAWIQSVISSNPANLQFSINGNLIGSNFVAASATCFWQEYSQTWNSGSDVMAEICITNQNTIGSGNDFAIDDLFFGPVCEQTDEMTITGVLVVATAPTNLELPCNAGALGIELNGVGSSVGTNYSYEWTTPNGNIVSGQNDILAYANMAGDYTLTVTFDDGNSTCDEITMVVVTDAVNPINSVVSTIFNIDCNMLTGLVSGAGSTGGNTLLYSWSTPNGNIVSGQNNENAVVDMNGTYLLTIFDVDSGCSETAFTNVTMDTLSPMAVIQEPDTINCAQDVIFLDGTLSTLGNDISYNWTTNNGGITSGSTTIMPQINQVGNYTLVVANGINGCTDTSSVEVVSNDDLPLVLFNPVDTLTCTLLQTQISATGSSEGNNYTFEWSTSDGQIISGDNTYTPTVNQGGFYILSITNTDNNCFREDSVFVNGNADAPLADIDFPDTLTCFINDVTLFEGSVQTVPNVSYSWSTNDGNITSGVDGQQINVDQVGQYYLEVMNTDNGCTHFDTVDVGQNVALPISDAHGLDTLNCIQNEVNLLGAGSSIEDQMVYQWSTNEGMIDGPVNMLNTQVSLPGFYYLEVTDTLNGCSALDSVEIFQAVMPPIAIAAPDNELNCIFATTLIDGTGSTFDPLPSSPYVYQWTTMDGNIVTGANTISPQVNEPGLYTFTILNTENNCTDTLLVDVFQNDTLPDVDAGLPQEIDCLNPQLALYSINSSTGSQFNYNWTTDIGNIVGINSLDSVLINQIGDYYLEITNTDNGCTQADTVSVTSLVDFPLLMIDPTDTLDCLENTITILGQNSSQGPQINYQWTTTSGNILTNPTQSNIDVDVSGYYTFQVENQDNGCLVQDSIFVEIDTISPSVMIADPIDLTCTTLTVDLDALGSSQGGYSYQWTTPDGNIISGMNTLTPTVDLIGQYTLEITNTQNNCTEEQAIIVDENIDLPVVNAGPDNVLDCVTATIDLAGEAISMGTYDILWSTADGEIDSGATTWSPTVSGSGTYTLTLTSQDNGCIDDDQVMITTTSIEDFAFTPSDITCIEPFGQIIIDTVIGGTAPYVYSIDDGGLFQTDSVFQGLEAANYSIVIQDANGCLKDSSSTIIEAQGIHTSLGDIVEISLGDSYQMSLLVDFDPTDIDTIIWADTTGLSCIDCLDPIASPLTTTDYAVLVRDLNGCEAIANLTIRVLNLDIVYYPNTFSPNGDGINDLFFPQAVTQSIAEIESLIIYDRWGEHLFTQEHFPPNDPTQGWDASYKGQEMKVGVYMFYSKVVYIDGTYQEIEGDVTLLR